MLYAILSAIALVLISITMLARANDLGWRNGAFWHFRRVGFVLAGFAPWAVIYMDFKTGGQFLTVFEVLFRLGVATVFCTTPYLPPWWKWISGYHTDESKTVIESDDRRGLPKKRDRS